jgi:hypothetical protein
MTEDQSLLQTIRIPKNLLFLSDKLPQPNYEKINKKNYNSFTKKNQNDLPDIAMVRGGIGSKNKKNKKENQMVENTSEGISNSGGNNIVPIPDTTNTNSTNVNGNVVITQIKKKVIKESSNHNIVHDNSSGKLNTIDEESKALREKSPKVRLDNSRNNSGHKRIENVNSNSNSDLIIKKTELPQLKNVSHKKKENYV